MARRPLTVLVLACAATNAAATPVEIDGGTLQSRVLLSGDSAVTVPVTGEVVLAWDDPWADGAGTVVPGHSFAVLRTQVR